LTQLTHSNKLSQIHHLNGTIETMASNTNLIAYCKTDQGLKRSSNQDICLASATRRCFTVADGMGGAAGGEIASALFLEAATEIFNSNEELLVTESRKKIESCFALANRKIQSHVKTNPTHAGMGCTAELMTVTDNIFILGHVGDSRTYCFHNNTLTQLTKDHSLVQEQLEQGVISQEQADKCRYQNILLRAVGTETDLKADIIRGIISPGTTFLLCSDGLYNMVNSEEITSVLSFDAPLPLKANMLIDMANDAGGNDNIAITLIQFPSDPTP